MSHESHSSRRGTLSGKRKGYLSAIDFSAMWAVTTIGDNSVTRSSADRFQFQRRICILHRGRRKTTVTTVTFEYISTWNTSTLECTLKICPARPDESAPRHRDRIILVSTSREGSPKGGRNEKGLRIGWKNPFDIVSNFFETRGRYVPGSLGLSRTCGVG